jgi:hypothetical protein
MRLLRPSLLLVISAVLCSFMLSGSLSLRGQSPEEQRLPQWQIDAGGSAKFDVASVKQDNAEPAPENVKSNIPLGPRDIFDPTGGLLNSTNQSLIQYIIFAYKLTTNRTDAVIAQLPKWAKANRFDILAHASGTKLTIPRTTHGEHHLRCPCARDFLAVAIRLFIFCIVFGAPSMAGVRGIPTSESDSAPRVFHLKGTVVSVDKTGRQLVIDQEAIPGVMDAMTMWYAVAVNDARMLDLVARGDVVTAEVVLDDHGFRLKKVVLVKKSSSSATSASARRSEGSRLTCQILADPSAYNGRLVQIRGSFRRTPMWTAIEDRDCGGEILVVEPSDPSVSPPTAFQIQDDDTFRSFKSYSEELLSGDASAHYETFKRFKYEIVATFVGHLDSADVLLPSGKARTLPGFGAQGTFRARLVLKAVSNVAATPRMSMGHH